MSETPSERVLHFLGALPHFRRTKVRGRWVVTRLTDGATITAPSDAESADDEFLVISWPGATRKVMTPGVPLAEMGIVAAMDFWEAVGEIPRGQKYEFTQDMLAHLDWKLTNKWALRVPRSRLDEYKAMLGRVVKGAAEKGAVNVLVELARRVVTQGV